MLYHEKENVRLKIPHKVRVIMSALNEYGHTSYIVGGCVRDSLLGIKPKDWDIATSMRPDDVLYTFNSLGYTVVPTGIKHGTVTVVFDGEHFEVTTYRKDGKYSDGRRPDKVEYANTIEEDLSRRDFTMNAIAYNEVVGIADPYDGFGDIRDKEIRTVGIPSHRFEEDGLRMLRAIRFSATHGFDIAPSTYRAICKNYELLKDISVERKREELFKILTSKNASFGIMHLQRTSLMDYIIPEIKDTKTFPDLDDLFNLRGLRLTYLLLDFHESFFRKILNNLKVDNDLKRLVVNTINVYDQIDDVDHVLPRHVIKELVRKYGEEEFFNALLIAKVTIKDNVYDKIADRFVDIVECNINGKEPIFIKDLAINGNDLVQIGFKGKEIGEALEYMLDYVTFFPEKNKKVFLIDLAIQCL